MMKNVVGEQISTAVESLVRRRRRLTITEISYRLKSLRNFLKLYSDHYLKLMMQNILCYLSAWIAP